MSLNRNKIHNKNIEGANQKYTHAKKNINTLIDWDKTAHFYEVKTLNL